MEDESSNWIPCYLHSNRPAVRDCAGCGRPICSDCASESGSRVLCAPCAGAEDTEAPGVDPEPVDPDAPAVEPGAGPPGEGLFPTTGSRLAGTLEALRSRLAGTLEALRSRWNLVSVPLRRGLYLGLAGCAGTYAFWLLVGVLWRQWLQTAVLAAGVVTAWATHRGVTGASRPDSGPQAYRPRALFTAVISVLVMGVLFVPAQYAACSILYFRTAVTAPLETYLSHYFGALDILWIVAGFLLAFGIPFFLSFGTDMVPETAPANSPEDEHPAPDADTPALQEPAEPGNDAPPDDPGR